MNFATILKIVQTATDASPAFIALFNQVKTVFSPAEQAQLQGAYEAAQKRSDDAHDRLQQAARDAQD